MSWNWQLKNWPNFIWQPEAFIAYEKQFLLNLGGIKGAIKHLDINDVQELTIEIISLESLGTSELEGEIFQRDSVRSSIMRALGLKSNIRANVAEEGVAHMMVDLYKTMHCPLTEALLFDWHAKLMKHDKAIEMVGGYRVFNESMQIVSGPDYARKIHFEAPKSAKVQQEMDAFNRWFSQNEQSELPAIIFSGIAHLWFESIHPFEDGNGRIGRAIAEKALHKKSAGQMPILLSKTLLQNRKQYYKQLGMANNTLDLTQWLTWFSTIILKAQQSTISHIEFIIRKAKLMDRLAKQLNSRQEKTLLRLFREGPEGFIGGLSAANYRAITGATTPTITRDLNDLVKKGALTKVGERKSTRYFLNLDD